MSRDSAVQTAGLRALPRPVTLGFDAHVTALRDAYGAELDATTATGNPAVVVLGAALDDEPAHEYVEIDGSPYRGAFTEALVEALDDSQCVAISWRAVFHRVSQTVNSRFLLQHPYFEGPLARELFSLTEPDGSGAVDARVIRVPARGTSCSA